MRHHAGVEPYHMPSLLSMMLRDGGMGIIVPGSSNTADTGRRWDAVVSGGNAGATEATKKMRLRIVEMGRNAVGLSTCC